MAVFDLSMTEIERLIASAAEDLLYEFRHPNALREPNPAKRAEYLERERVRFETKLARLSDLSRAWLEHKIKILSHDPC